MKTSKPGLKQPIESKDKFKKVLIAAIIALLLGNIVGAYLWNSQAKEHRLNRDIDAQRIQDLERKVNSLESSSSQSTEENSNTEYLSIKEWSIKIPIKGDLAGASYSFSLDDKSGIALTTKSLIDISPKCILKNSNADGVIYIERVTEANSNTKDEFLGDRTPKEAFPNGVTVAGYYYHTFSGQSISICEEAIGNQNQEIIKVRDAVNSAIKMIKAS